MIEKKTGSIEDDYFSDLLLRIMEERGWSQRELSRRLKTHYTTLNAWIYKGDDTTRRLIPGPKHLQIIAELSGHSTPALLAARSLIQMKRSGIEIAIDNDIVPSHEDLHPPEHSVLLQMMQGKKYMEAVEYILREWRRQSQIEEEKSKKKGGKGK